MALIHRILRYSLFSHHPPPTSFLLPLSFSSSSGSSDPSNPQSPPPENPVSDEDLHSIPVVSYPALPRQDWSPSPKRDASDSSSETPSAPSFSSDIIPPAYEGHKPRVAPLPEYRGPQEQDQPDGPQGRGAGVPLSARKPAFSLKWKQVDEFIPEDELEIPVPSFAKVETKRRPDPVTLLDAIRQVKEHRKPRFDATVEVAVRLGVDPKRSDQLVRGAATLPHGTGKVVRVAVFAEGDEAEEAKSAGADVVGSDELVDRIMESGGKLDFDKCVATPSMMPMLSKVARILGPRGLMPNPKVGTVTKNVGNAVKHLKQGRVDFRADKTGIVHAGVGKVSFNEDALQDNIAAFANAIIAAKPVGLKKTSKYAGYMVKFSICSTMGPGVRVLIPSISQAVEKYVKMMDLQ